MEERDQMMADGKESSGEGQAEAEGTDKEELLDLNLHR